MLAQQHYLPKLQRADLGKLECPPVHIPEKFEFSNPVTAFYLHFSYSIIYCVSATIHIQFMCYANNFCGPQFSKFTGM